VTKHYDVSPDVAYAGYLCACDAYFEQRADLERHLGEGPTHPREPHADSAAQALINEGWIEIGRGVFVKEKT
jgi:hypothetical protein